MSGPEGGNGAGNDPTPRIAICYLRVSTRAQGESGLGLDAQRDACDRYAAHRLQGWTIEYVTEVASGATRSRSRPLLADALQRLDQAGAGALVVARLDRLTRRVADLLHIFDRSRSNAWRLLIDDFDADLTSPFGQAFLQMMGVVAELERNLASERTRNALQAAKRRGVRFGRPTSIPDDVLEEIRQLREQDLSYQKIADWLNAAGIPTAQNSAKGWHRQGVRRALITEQLNRAARAAETEWQGSLFE